MELLKIGKLTLTACMLLWLSGCARNINTSFTSQDRQLADSIANSKGDIDELIAFEKGCQERSDILGQLTALRVIGQRYRNESRFNDALLVHKKGYDLAEECGDTIELVRALNNIGTNYRRIGILDLAASNHYRALSVCMESNDTSVMAKKNRVISLNGLGNIYLSLDNRVLADSVLRQALAGEKELGSAIGQAINYANLGAIFESDGQIDSAWAYYRRSMEMNEKEGSDVGIALCHTNYGKLYQKARKYPQALEEYQKALSIMSKSKDEWHALEVQLSMARVYNEKGDGQQAKAVLDSALLRADSIHSLEHLSEIYRLFYHVYDQQGDATKALSCYRKAEELEDSIINLQKMSQIQNMRVNVIHEEQQKKYARIQGEIEHERTTKWIIMALMGVLLILSLAVVFLAFQMLRRRSRIQKMEHEVQEARDRFFTNITHEFRTPLTVMHIASLELKKQVEILSLPNEETMMKHIRNIDFQGCSLLSLINQILDLAQLSTVPKEKAVWRSGDVATYIEMIVASYQGYAGQRGQTLVVDANPKPLTMDFVPDLINKIVRNLVANAIKFSPQGAKILVTVSRVGNKMRLSVKDHGAGMKSEQMEHIFEPFFQTADDTQNIGTGIGLSLVKLAVDAMNGTVSVASKEQKGTEFVVMIDLKHGDEPCKPLAQEAYDMPSHVDYILAKSEVKNVMDDGDTNVRREGSNGNDDTDGEEDFTRVLIVEDSVDLAKYIGGCLPGNYATFYAENGRKGLEKAQSIVPDLIITDVMMPEMDGYELCRQVRSSALLNHIPIIMVTARTTQQDEVQGLECGADAYLQKPFNADILRLYVENQLEQRRLLRRKTVLGTEGTSIEVKSQASMAVLSEMNKQFLGKLDKLIGEQMEENKMEIGDLASALYITRVQLNRKIKAITGMSTTAYVTHVRMMHAKRLLIERPDMTIGEISIACGILDVAYFSRKFKQETGVTPSQYRKMSLQS